MRIRGRVTAIERDATGAELARQTTHNLFLNTGLIQIAAWHAGRSENFPGQLVVGTGSNAPAPTDTTLQAQVYSRSIDRRTIFFVFGAPPPVPNIKFLVTLAIFIPTTDANGNTLREVGVQDISGTFLYARALLQTPVVKTSSKSVTIFHELDVYGLPSDDE